MTEVTLNARDIWNRVDGMHTFEEVMALQRFASVAPDGVAVNVGCYRGLSTIVLASTRETYAVDPFEDMFLSSPVYPDGHYYTADNLDYFKANIEKMGVADRVHLLRNKSEDEARRWRKPVSVVLLDFDPVHMAPSMPAWGRFVVEGGYLIAHDINEPPVAEGLAALETAGGWARVATVDLLAVYQRTGGGYREGMYVGVPDYTADMGADYVHGRGITHHTRDKDGKRHATKQPARGGGKR